MTLAGNRHPVRSRREGPGRRVVDFRTREAIAARVAPANHQDLAVGQQRDGVILSRHGHAAGRHRAIGRRVVDLGGVGVAAREQHLAVGQQRAAERGAAGVQVGDGGRRLDERPERNVVPSICVHQRYPASARVDEGVAALVRIKSRRAGDGAGRRRVEHEREPIVDPDRDRWRQRDAVEGRSRAAAGCDGVAVRQSGQRQALNGDADDSGGGARERRVDAESRECAVGAGRDDLRKLTTAGAAERDR